MKIQTKRIYERPGKADGVRILVDRIWPRGVSREKANVAYWAKDIAPSNELRRWYHHDHEKWDKFRDRYFKELDQNTDGIKELLEQFKRETVTLVFSSKELDLNNAAALKEYIEKMLSKPAV
jgi:uncharacterized protein YeaO (DUF488 family)